MFEKEAKERARTLEGCQTLGVYDDDESYARDLGWNEGEVAGYEEGFKDGAEFGYNKAFKAIAELEKENAKLKKQVENRNCSNCRLNKTGCPNDGSCHNFSLWRPFINPKLTKAKEIIKDYMIIAKGAHITECGVSEENRTINVLKLNEKAEEFLNSEVEK